MVVIGGGTAYQERAPVPPTQIACVDRPGRLANPNGYNEGCRCVPCTEAKLAANSRSLLRTGRIDRTPDGMVLAVCWCGESTVLVHESVVGRVTESCGRAGCGEAPAKARLHLLVDAEELERLRELAAARGRPVAAVVREAIRLVLAA